MDAPAGAAAASAAAAPPRAPGKPPFAKVLVDEFLRAHDSKVRGSSTRAAALDAGALAALAAAPWQLLLIVGPTASGKTLALAQLSEVCALLPDRSADFEFSRDRAVVSHFGSPDAAVLRLGLVGACARQPGLLHAPIAHHASALAHHASARKYRRGAVSERRAPRTRWGTSLTAARAPSARRRLQRRAEVDAAEAHALKWTAAARPVRPLRQRAVRERLLTPRSCDAALRWRCRATRRLRTWARALSRASRAPWPPASAAWFAPRRCIAWSSPRRILASFRGSALMSSSSCPPAPCASTRWR